MKFTFYIVGDRAFTKNSDAIIYCKLNNMSEDCIVNAKPIQKQKYFELQTTYNNQIFHNKFYTSVELSNPETQRYIRELRNGELTSRLVHLKEITEREYVKCISY